MGNPPVHRARKRFGQNFLHDQGVIHRIVSSINPRPGQSLVEIGPGRGALTLPLLEACGKLTAIELDRDLIPLLEKKAATVGDLKLVNQDVLQLDLSSLQLEPPLRIVGNLPYNISTPLMFHLLEYSGLISDMTFMLQKEVAERILASPGDKHYGKLSVMMSCHCDGDFLLDVPPASFSPRPKVNSAVIRLRPLTQPRINPDDLPRLEQVVTAAFGQRRKTIANSLKNLLDRDRITDLGLDPGARAETLSLNQFALLAGILPET
jgi:16S rRNA (adenine1518-N6/adenine1519-N6)-dimethyltransferase